MAKRVAAVQISDRNPHADEDSDRGEEPLMADDTEDHEVEPSARRAAWTGGSATSNEADLQRRKYRNNAQKEKNIASYPFSFRISKPRSLLQRVRGSSGGSHSSLNSQGSMTSTAGSLFAGLPTNPFAGSSSVSLPKSSSSVEEVKTKMQGLNKSFVDAAQHLFERNPAADFGKLFEQYRKHLQSFKSSPPEKLDAKVANVSVFTLKKPATVEPAPIAQTQATAVPSFPSQAAFSISVESPLKPSASLSEFKPAVANMEAAESPAKTLFPAGSPMKESAVPIGTDMTSSFSFRFKPTGPSSFTKADEPKPAPIVAEQHLPSTVPESNAQSIPIPAFSFATEAKPLLFSIGTKAKPVVPITTEAKPSLLSIATEAKPVVPITTEAKPPLFPVATETAQPVFPIASATQTPASPADSKPTLSFGMSPAPAPFNFNISATTTQAPLASPLTAFSFGSGGNTAAFAAPQLPKFSFGVPATAIATAPNSAPFSFSAAPVVPVNNGPGAHEADEDNDNDNDIPEDERDSFTHTRTTSEALKTGAGEEHEETVHEQRCKVFLLADKDKGWMDLGVGLLKVNRDRRAEAQGQSRLLCRAEGSGRIVLNTRVSPIGTEATHVEGKKEVALLAFGADGKPCKYLIRVKTLEEAVQLRTAIQAEIDHVKATKN